MMLVDPDRCRGIADLLNMSIWRCDESVLWPNWSEMPTRNRVAFAAVCA